MLNLWCLFKHEEIPFKITVQDGDAGPTHIADLKKIIKQENQQFLASVDAKDLRLWKLKEPTTSVKTNLLHSLNDIAVELDPREAIVDVFLEPLSDKDIHIIVDTGVNNTVSRDTHWITDWHAKLWGKASTSPVLRKITLGLMDFRHLRRQLKSVSPNDYAAIIRVKSELLASLPSRPPEEITDVSGSDGETEDSMDDDQEEHVAETQSSDVSSQMDDEDKDDIRNIRFLFPYSMDYLDLTSLKECFRAPRLILLRSEYEELEDILANRPIEFNLLTGTPGIGTTTYLYARLIRNLLDGKVMLFQDNEGNVFHIADTVKRMPAAFSSYPDLNEVTEALVDTDDNEPHVSLLKFRQFRIIATTPPRPWWENKWMTQRDSLGFVLNNWDFYESLSMSVFLSDRKISPETFVDVGGYFGNNPRPCLLAASDEQKFKGVLFGVEVAASQFRTVDELIAAISKRDGNYDIFHLEPKDDSRLYQEAVLNMRSKWVAKKVFGPFGLM